MRQLLYVSNTTQGVSVEVLEQILAVSRRNNRAVSITGVLLFLDGGFLQVLEGEEAAVRTTFVRICADTRHWNLHTLFDRDAPRAFKAWSMGFRHIKSRDAANAEMFDITQQAIMGRLEPDAGPEVFLMLKSFCKVQDAAIS
jgi:hypothetical protein